MKRYTNYIWRKTDIGLRQELKAQKVMVIQNGNVIGFIILDNTIDGM